MFQCFGHRLLQGAVGSNLRSKKLSFDLYLSSYFGIYDTLKPLVLRGELKDSFAASFAIAFFSTTAGEILAYPLDTVKRRM